MPTFISPLQAAQAFGVSESSLKRWCDRGLIRSHRTAGGHRRLDVQEVIAFSRSSGQRLVSPEILGLTSKTRKNADTLKHALKRVRNSLTQGDIEACRGIVGGLFAAGYRVSEICDVVIAPACHEIGDLWKCGEVEIYQERRACEICLHLLEELSRLLPAVVGRVPFAIGGSPEGDPYALPTRMVELVLREHGWTSQSLGSSLPLRTLSAAVDELRPDVLWLSVSHLQNRDSFLAEYREFYNRVRNRVAVVVGGQALDESTRRQMEYAAHCDNLQHLENFAALLKSSLRPKRRKVLSKTSAT